MTMSLILEQPVSHLLSRLESGTSRWMIGMAGLPGSGKSTLAARLATEVNARTQPDTMIALGMDGFHLSKAELRCLPDPDAAFARRGAPWTFNPDALLKKLQSVRESIGCNSVSVEWPGFEHQIGDPVAAAFTISPTTRLILVEGLYLLQHDEGWRSASQCFDERWYLDTPLDIALERLTLRHMSAWNLTRDEAQARIAANDRLNAEIVAPSRAFADYLIEDAVEAKQP